MMCVMIYVLLVNAFGFAGWMALACYGGLAGLMQVPFVG